MKRKKMAHLKSLGLAVGIFLGRGAQADTVLTFDALPPGQNSNQAILQTFGDNAAASSGGVSVVGDGTPNIGLTWTASTQEPANRWDYYLGGVWSAAQLNEAHIEDYYEVVFTPSGSAAAKINSFNFHGYYNSSERFTFNWEVLSGATSLTNGIISFRSDATKNHPVSVDYTGAPGEELVLRLTRADSTPFLEGAEFDGDKGNIAVDDISFAEIAGGPPAPIVGSQAFQDYVLRDAPLAYYRLRETDVASNSGSLGSAGNGVHVVGVTHPVSGAIIGSSDTAASYGTNVLGEGLPTLIPNQSSLNSSVFTVEAWVKPAIEGLANAASPLANRVSNDGAGGRQGWVFFQRAAIGQTPPDGNGSGFNFRMYKAGTTSAAIDITGGAYAINAWTHLAATFDGTTARLYQNGIEVASGIADGTYAPNTREKMAIGAWAEENVPGGYENPYTGAVDEVALYTNALSATQILAHYTNGNNPSPPVSYDSLITSDGAVGYYRLNEPAFNNVAVNLGTLGAAANGVFVNTVNGVTGPRPSTYSGFETNNVGTFFDGHLGYVGLGNPAGLNISGQITLEAWVQPAASQRYFAADVIAHGVNAADNAEVLLRLVDVGTASARYQVGAWDGANAPGVTFNIPTEDLGGNWVHLVGTYDGANWNLYRNGTNAASAASAIGAVVVNDADWAIGGRGWSGGPDRLFTGGIDEVAIYNYALAPENILAHYNAAKFGPLLTLAHTNNNVVLTWPVGTLQASDLVTGMYEDVVTTSPYSVPANEPQKFYRVKF